MRNISEAIRYRIQVKIISPLDLNLRSNILYSAVLPESGHYVKGHPWKICTFIREGIDNILWDNCGIPITRAKII